MRGGPTLDPPPSREADTRGHALADPLDLDGDADRFPNSMRQQARLLAAPRRGNRELITPVTAEAVGRRIDQAGEQGRHGPQNAVPDDVTESLVHDAEVVQVDEDRGNLLS